MINTKNLLSNSFATISLPKDTIEKKEMALKALISFLQKSDEEKNAFSFPLEMEHGYRDLKTKESVIIRGSNTPQSLEPLERLATEMSIVCSHVLAQIENELGLKTIPIWKLTLRKAEEIDATLLRGFKYLPTNQLASEAHDDLGLISIVLRSNCAALEVMDNNTKQWLNVEEPLLNDQAIVMIGKSLSYITNNKINSCHHRVGANEATRYSLVYQLRIADTAIFDSDDFKSEQIPARSERVVKTGKEIIELLRQGLTSINGSYGNTPLENNKTKESFFFLRLRSLENRVISLMNCIQNFVKSIFSIFLELFSIQTEKAFVDKNITIICKTLTGKKYPLVVKLSDKIEVIQNQIYHKEGIPVKEQRLIFQGKQCDDQKTVCSYGMDENSTVRLVLKMKGD